MSSHRMGTGEQSDGGRLDPRTLGRWVLDERLGITLSPVEMALLARVEAGELLDLGGREQDDGWDNWGIERRVRAGVLRHLLVVSNGPPVHARGVRIRGARIVGPLDLGYATLRCPLELIDCALDSPEALDLTGATVSTVSLTGCRIVGPIQAGGVVVKQRFELSRSLLYGPVLLANADITGSLVLSGSTLMGRDTEGRALHADGIRVGGDLTLDAGFTAYGVVWLVGADVDNQLVCSGACLLAGDRNGNAMCCDEIKVLGTLFLDEGFLTHGAVRLNGGEIGAQLKCHGARFHGRDEEGRALLADRLRVGGDINLDQGFSALGAVSLRAASAGGTLRLEDCELLGLPKTLDAAGMRVCRELRWAPRVRAAGLVNLEQVSAGRLDDEWTLDRPDGNWPPEGMLRLDGFTYEGFGGRNLPPAQDRVQRWIRKGNTRDRRRFASQPYEQLAQVYRRAGKDSEARYVEIARRADLRQYGDLTGGRWFLNWLLDVTVKYGYKIWRMAVVLLVLYLVAFGMSVHAQHRDDDVIVPTRTVAGAPKAPDASSCSAGYPCFYPVGFAADLVLPVIKVGQSDSWRINGNASWGWVYVVASYIVSVGGWLSVTLIVAGLSGLARQD